ncbi:MAG: phosphoribosylamine---glycine ligase [Abditibacteriota bacterium]|nr:phosphoribosylamine---glycine ligase [Abditibacteriota bacterium]
MKVLVLGGGGREHALCWKIVQSPLVSEIFCTPGNAGIARIATCLSGDAVDVAREVGADFVVVGPDDLLAEGIVDRLTEAGIPAFGPTQQAAQLEASKLFCKELLRRYNIPTGDFAGFDSGAAAKAYLSQREGSFPIVVKADGLALGKGVVVAQTREEALEAVDHVIAAARGKERIVIEECLVGEEISLLAFTDGETVVPMVPAQDHKRVGEGDTGPNTGGMGCYSPVPVLTPELTTQAIETILKPTLQGLRSDGITFRGVLYAGLMLTADGLKVLEFNCRFGDPETQVLLPRLQSDLMPLLLACAGATQWEVRPLPQIPCEWTEQAAVTVVMASHGYPGTVRKGDAISGLEEAAQTGAIVFHAGTAQQDNQIVTSGGRVLSVTALGDVFHQARENVYRGVGQIHFDGAHFRRDIGWRCL